MFTQNLITDINDRPSLRPPLGSALAALACIVGLWFVAFAFLPKTEALATASQVSLPRAFPIATGVAAILRTLLFPIAAIILVAFFASLVGAFSFTIRRLAGATLRFSVVVLVPLMGALLIVSWIGLYYIYEKQTLRARYFERALESFAIDESLNDRFESKYTALKTEQNIEPVAIDNVAALPPAEQRSRLAMLVKALGEATDPGARKRILATLPPFQPLVVGDADKHAFVLSVASETARESFQDVPDFFEWLAEQPAGTGWEPLPLYRFETP